MKKKKIHNIKLLGKYATDKLQGLKPFEIRLNDRDYKVGDYVKYSVPDNKGLNTLFSTKLYEITYITDFAQQEGYVVFTDSLVVDYRYSSESIQVVVLEILSMFDDKNYITENDLKNAIAKRYKVKGYD